MTTVQLEGMTIGIRDATPGDEAVVFSAWLKGHRENGDWPKRVGSHRYFDTHKTCVARLLARSKTLVACHSERPTQVLGFLCTEPGVLHWLWTKHVFRRLGVAQALWQVAELRGPTVRCSHWTRGAAMLVQHGWPLWFDPFLIEET